MDAAEKAVTDQAQTPMFPGALFRAYGSAGAYPECSLIKIDLNGGSDRK